MPDLVISDNFSFSQLLKLVPSYYERSNDEAFTTMVPVWVALAENRLATDLKTQGFQMVVAGTFDLQPLMKKPAFWKENLAFNYLNSKGKKTPLFLRPLEWVQAYAPDPTERGDPLYYADYNANFFYIGPTPQARYPFELSYYARLQPLGPQNDSNWMTTYMPQALFYAVLLEAAIWSKNPSQEQKFQTHYNQSIGSLGAENSERLTDRTQAVTRA